MVLKQSVGSLCRKCHEAPKPVIGVINGYAGPHTASGQDRAGQLDRRTLG